MAFIVSGFDAPAQNAPHTHPPQLKGILQKQNYLFAPTPQTPAETLKSFFDSFESQKNAFLYLKRNQNWDVLVMVFMQLDAAQHFYWQEMLEQKRPEGQLIYQLYQKIDALIGELMADLDDKTTLIILSDHGAGPLKANRFHQ